MICRRLVPWVLAIVALASLDVRADTSEAIFAQRPGQPLRLDIFRPATPPPSTGYPANLCIHGGGWSQGSRHFTWLAPELVKAGFLVISPDYRLTNTAIFPAQLDDVRDAAAWMLAHAKELQINPQRIGLAGGSAGGHLALLLGLAPSQSYPGGESTALPKNTFKAICALYPPTDLTTIVPFPLRSRPDNLVAKLLGGAVTEKAALARAASPLEYVKSDSPPILLIHGEKDRLVPVWQSTVLNTAYQKAGAKSEMILLPEAGHGFAPDQKTETQIADFFARYLGKS